LDIRRFETTVLDNQDSKALKDYAHALINGKIIGVDGKVV
jgi:hypothetical protein